MHVKKVSNKYGEIETLFTMYFSNCLLWNDKHSFIYIMYDSIRGKIFKIRTLRDTINKKSHHFTMPNLLSNSLILACNTFL